MVRADCGMDFSRSFIRLDDSTNQFANQIPFEAYASSALVLLLSIASINPAATSLFATQPAPYPNNPI
jgi:hypothetical protein